MTLLRVGVLALRYRRLLAALPLTFLAAAVCISLLLPRTFTVSGAFLPQGPSTNGGRLAGLAAQLGVSMPGTDPSVSPDFYAALLTSKSLLTALADTLYSINDSTGTRTIRLATFLDLEGEGNETKFAVLRWLQSSLAVRTDELTGLIRFSITTTDSSLSLAIARRLLDQVNASNLARRGQGAELERRFIEARLSVASEELRASEDRMAHFLGRNRQYGSSPELQSAFDRLQRDVTMRSQIYTSLLQAYEEARIEAVRSTPTISVVEAPSTPLLPDRRGTMLRGLLALIAGTVLAITLVAMRELIAIHRSSRSPDYVELVKLSSSLGLRIRDRVRSVARRT